MASSKINNYPACEGTKRQKVNATITKENADAIGRNYRILPLFEKGIFEYTYRKAYSLESNEYLRCRWDEYRKHFEDRVFAPFTFIDLRDYHFINCCNRYIPAASIHTRKDHRRKLKPGPGVDSVGQLPVPNELLMVRGTKNVQKKPKVYLKTENQEKSKH